MKRLIMRNKQRYTYPLNIPSAKLRTISETTKFFRKNLSVGQSPPPATFRPTVFFRPTYNISENAQNQPV